MGNRSHLRLQASAAERTRLESARTRPPLRIAMLTHSVNPRGGVVHALALSEHLQADGHDVTLFAPDPRSHGLFRDSGCRFQSIPGPMVGSDLRALVRQRIADYVRFFSAPAAPRFDLYHAQDSISANALADLTDAGLIPGFIRTVHHLDVFEDPQLAAWQERGMQQAQQRLCVSRVWQALLASEYGIAAECVTNGVDLHRYSPTKGPRDDAVRRRYGLMDGPVFLAIGGMEARKNTLAVIAAFIEMRCAIPNAQLVIAGGASMLDHAAYQSECSALLEQHGLTPWVSDGPHGGDARVRTDDSARPVVVTGTVPDEDMPCLYRCADALVFPSIKEGFGLAVLEAMASGVPAIVSRIAPFTEYLDDDTCVWVDPRDVASIVRAMGAVLDPLRRDALIAVATRRAAEFSWEASARRHVALYHAYLHHTQTKESIDA